ncbi:MAG: hypothetical protein CEN91_161 [Candidatus Berkelbacteria bacterium Licking1014_85]|uniref:Uncharacterized protein n=1 Tax=Candidatus Berkelbacteria bacterium Licking1014_85 TaxID=2017148 RepID=A0A554LLB0_9BACT|nr:MAG: hypothetical protein CEN91_161 [Candidatus Berkelbacteria bacterium Licking1014_85]
MAGKALTDGEIRELYASVIEGIPNRGDLDSDAVRAHLGAKTVSHKAIQMVLGMEPQQVIELLVVTSPVQAVSTPDGLLTTLESQADRLMAIGAFNEARINKGKYRDDFAMLIDAMLDFGLKKPVAS